MIPINNSDTAWLITADFNQDNNLPYEELKEDIISPDVNLWVCENHPIFNFPELCRKGNNIVYGGIVGSESLFDVGHYDLKLRGNTVGSASEIGKLVGGIVAST